MCSQCYKGVQARGQLGDARIEARIIHPPCHEKCADNNELLGAHINVSVQANEIDFTTFS
jgi:hypothetical protein